MIETLLNRPMLESDVTAVAAWPRAQELRALVDDFRRNALPVMNGSFAYSNLREANDQILTCGPHRLWEYASLFLLYDPAAPWRRALDVGGAASPLPYQLAASGIATRAVDLQPHLVALCNYVAGVRGLPLQAFVEDVTAEPQDREPFDLITFISVLEHIPAELHPRTFQALHDRLAPGGLLYLTFDYGTYVEQDTYHAVTGQPVHTSGSIANIETVCAAIEAAGLTFVGNDPRQLPADVLALRHSPAIGSVMRRMAMNVGPIDARTPWRTIAGYLGRRLFKLPVRMQTRFHKHNFFRMFLQKAQ